MTRNPVERPRLVVFVVILWILAWSLFRMWAHRQDLAGSDDPTSFLYPFLVIVTGLLTAGWAIGGFLLLSHWHQIATSLVEIARQSRVVYWSLWLVPAALWTFGFALYRLAGPANAALMDGPTLVLAFGGLAVFVCLIKYLCMESEEKQIELSSVSCRSCRRDSSWSLVGAGSAMRVPVILITATTLLLFRDSLFDPESTVFGLDVFSLHYMFENLVREAWSAGQLPLWNPYIFSGSPALSHPQYLAFYPPQMLLRLLPLNLSLSWAAAVHVWIAGMGMFALCRRLKLQTWIALTCALVYMLNSGLLLRVFAGHVWYVYALAWFPLVWMLVMIALDSGRTIAIVGASVAMSMIIMTGHPTFIVYILLFLGLYWMYVCRELWRKAGSRRPLLLAAIRFVVIMVLATGLSAIQLAPSAVMAGQVSVAGGYDPAQANFLALSFPDLLAILIPQLYSAPEKLMLYWELIPYMGIVFILLLPLPFATRRPNSLAYFLGATALFSLALAFGESVGAYSLLYRLLPPFRVIRIPPRSLMMWIPSVTILGGMGLQAVSNRTVSVKWFAFGTRACGDAGLFILAAAAGHWLNRQGAFSDKLSAGGLLSLQIIVVGLASILVPIVLASRFSYPRRSRTRLPLLVVPALLGFLFGVVVVPSDLFLAGNLIVVGLLVGVSGLLIAYLHRYGPAPLTVLALVALVCVDLGSFSLPHVFAQHPPVFYEYERVLFQHVDVQDFGRVVSSASKLDQYMLGHVRNIDGYNTGILQGYETFLRAISGNRRTGVPWVGVLSAPSKIDLDALSFLGVEYIIATDRIEADELELVTSDDGYYLYRKPGAFPRAYLVYDVLVVDDVRSAVKALLDEKFDYARTAVLLNEPEIEPGKVGEASVRIEKHSPSSGNLTLRVYTSEPGVLVMSEPYFSERRLWVDGQEAKPLRANVGFIAASLSAGKHEVELRYVPTSLYVGAAITALTLLIIVGVLLYSRFSASSTERCAKGSWPSKGGMGE